jgi:hypothetical protein
MKVFVGIILGFFSGFLIYMAAATLFASSKPSAAFVFATFFGGWGLSSWVIVRDARTISKVFSRGFFLEIGVWNLIRFSNSVGKRWTTRSNLRLRPLHFHPAGS